MTLMTTIRQLLLTFLLNAVWQVPLIVASAAFCSWLLRQATARYRHLVWVAALFLSFGLPAFAGSRILTDGVAAATFPQQTSGEQARVKWAGGTAPSQPATTALAVAPSAIQLNRKLVVFLLSSYFLFLGYRGYRLVWAWRTTKAIKSSASPIQLSGSLATIIARCQAAIPNTGVRVLGSPSVPQPITMGWIEPLIILPEQLLREGNVDLLTSAVGHEFIHVARHDYLLNLIYELIYLPLSFHPAAAILRRRIKQTRELCCDELVAEKVLDREVYARSLVKLAASAPLLRRLSVNTTVGIADADILEVRIMSLLKPRLLVRRKALLLVVSLLLALPCVAVASFGMRFDLKTQPPQNALQEPTETQKGTRKARATYRIWPEYPEDARAAKVEGTVLLSAMIGTDGSMQDVQVTKSVFPSVDASAVAAVRQWRFEPALKDGQPVSTRLSIELVFNQRVWEGQQKEKEHRIVEEREMKARAEIDGKTAGWAVTEQGAKGEVVTRLNLRDGRQVYGVLVPDREETARQREEREQEGLQQAELAKAAKITMDQAIQIARGQNPGTVLECSLVGEHWEAPGRLSKDSQVLYHVVILSSSDSKTTTHVLVNAVDGRIVTIDLRGREMNE
jgi:TonB family protein